MIFPSLELIKILHKESISAFGGRYGIKDNNALLSTLDRPKQLRYYKSGVTIFDMAASLGYGFAKNHVFTDGNKRIALISALTFMELNGVICVPKLADEVIMMEGVANGTRSEADLSQFFSDNTN
jgi:death-on-curing protein